MLYHFARPLQCVLHALQAMVEGQVASTSLQIVWVFGASSSVTTSACGSGRMGLPGDFRRGAGRFGRLPEPRLGGAIRPTSRGLGRCGLTHPGVGSEANKAPDIVHGQRWRCSRVLMVKHDFHLRHRGCPMGPWDPPLTGHELLGPTNSAERWDAEHRWVRCGARRHSHRKAGPWHQLDPEKMCSGPLGVTRQSGRFWMNNCMTKSFCRNRFLHLLSIALVTSVMLDA